MLTVLECRKILGKKISDQYTDEQIEEMRGTLYGLADRCINRYLREIEEKKANGVSQPVAQDALPLAEKKRSKLR